MGDEFIHLAHCSVGLCRYGDTQCPVRREEFPGGRAEAVLEALKAEDGHVRVEFCVRSKSEDWVYALPRLIPKTLYGKRGTREAAEWHLTRICPEPEDRHHFEIVKRVVGDWEVAE